MKYPPSEILAQHLIEKNLAQRPADNAGDWQAFIGRMPPAPDNAIMVADTSPEPIADLLRGPRLQWEGVQIIIRGGKEAAGYNAAHRRGYIIKAYFEQLKHDVPVVFEDAGYLLHYVRLDSGPMFIGNEEETERPLFSSNYLIHLSPT